MKASDIRPGQTVDFEGEAAVVWHAFTADDGWTFLTFTTPTSGGVIQWVTFADDEITLAPLAAHGSTV